MLTYLLLVLFSTITLCCFSQDSLSWKKTFGNQYNDITGHCISTNDKGYLLYGFVKPNGPVNQNGFDWGIYKLDSCGNKLWEKTFVAASGFNELHVAKQTLDNGFLLAGTSVNSSGDFSTNYGGSDPWVFKLDASGNVQWKKNVSGSANDDYYFSASVLPDSSFLLGGVYDRRNDAAAPQNNRDHGRLTRLDKDGNIIWDRIIDTAIIGTVWAINVTAGNKIIAAGFTNIAIGGIQTGRSDGKLAQFSTDGVLEWHTTARGSQTCFIRSVLSDGQQNVYTSGYTNNNAGEFAANHGSNDFFLYKYDRNGNKLWGKLFGGAKDDQGWNAGFVDETSILITGYSMSADGDFSVNNGNTDAFVLKTDTSGNIIGNMDFGGTGFERAISLSINADRSYVIAGYTGPTSLFPVNGISDLFIAKFRHIPANIIDSNICQPVRFDNIVIAKDTAIEVAPIDACGNTAYRTLYRFHYKAITLSSIPDTAVTAGTSLSLTTNSNAVVTWDADAGLSCTNCLSPVIRALMPHQYIVNAHNNYCSMSDTVNILIKENPNGFYVPSAFTPNGDGLNDVFRALGNAKYFELVLFNRWGETVFRSTNIAEGWNGYYKGKMQGSGTFIYIISYIPHAGNIKLVQKGTMVLIR